ncbi:tail fiber domain-containing protein [Flavobacterium urocaniciphilum]|uniref:Chaperone of endosialidase n=1 Tax=Flavobacterium urocaniciphilum TaxID=1299341 RepID=A0A1H9E1X8_9FLAO|nr:tail fiber domain-containing protein [Flavobacterium urocaniciphilum]SEQ18948.1 Chaperone of endosialidase [Flavobacterium urocaniciphilum]
MKKLIITSLLITNSLFAQVGIGTVTPDPSSILHLNSTNAGFLAPRLTNAQKNAILSPATGLLIYQTDGAFGFWYYNGTAWVPFGGANTYTFNNGLTLTGSNAQLGGDLIKSTTIDLKDYDLTFKTTSTSTYPGDLVVEGKNRKIMETSIYDNFVHFGGGYPYIGTSVDGTTLTDYSGSNYTIDVVASFQTDGAIAGSAIKTGSVEYLMDGISELYLEGSAGFHPRNDNTSSFGASLGSTTKRWASVYANNGVIQTSDVRFKKNIKPLEYGLNEVLQLNTITYNWKNNKIGNTIIPDEFQETKIGFSAQNLLEVIPEVVETHTWQPVDENGNYTRLESNKLGVNYSELIPVLVNAIKDLKAEIDSLKKELNNK